VADETRAATSASPTRRSSRQRRCLGRPRDAARSHDASLGGKDESVDYPARSLSASTTASSDDDAVRRIRARRGDQIEADTTRFGMRTRPWERTQVKSSINTQATEFGPRTFANFGLTQGFQWKDTGRSTSASTRQHAARPDLEPLNPNAPLASGSMNEDFFARVPRAQYRQDLWQLTSRLEHRNSDTEQRWSSTTGWYREPVEGHAMSVSLQAFDSSTLLGGGDTKRSAALPGPSAPTRARGSCSTASR
jgi:hypothetical protein